ncbi:TatD family hydrolase [Candidatus Palauibacter sp.]|uniref:TatD family hydrolase n=1 Tax=Candidatus Palauibacter sp. TaxID=3101350 RepID=UPI003B5C783B
MTRPDLFDSHLHLTAARFFPDLGEVLERARRRGVGGMVTVASNPEDASDAVALAVGTQGLWATAGLHPHEADRTSASLLAEIERIAAAPEVVAIGETGLDFHYDNAARAAQIENFEAHLGLADRLGLPIVVHSRSAEADTAALVREYGDGVSGVLHCFTGGEALLDAALEADWYVSFSGLITFVAELAGPARAVPADRLLIETDAPYLAPVPRRGRRNEPGFLPHTCERLAELRGMSFDDTAAATTANARRFYGLETLLNGGPSSGTAGGSV